MQPARRSVLITGAGDGIGRALARVFHDEGAHLVLVGRRPLEEVTGDVIGPDTYVQADLTEEGSIDRVEAALDARSIEGLDVVVHNAAVASFGALDAESDAVTDAMIDVNLWAPIAWTHRLLPRLEARRGKLVFIGSVAAFVPCPEYAVYGATKAALDGFARSLRTELRSRVDVRVVHPGAVRTRIHEKAGVPPERVSSPRIPSAEATAALIHRSLDRRRAVRVLGAGPRVVAWAGRHLRGPVDRAARRRS